MQDHAGKSMPAAQGLSVRMHEGIGWQDATLLQDWYQQAACLGRNVVVSCETQRERVKREIGMGQKGGRPTEAVSMKISKAGRAEARSG